MNNRCFWCNTNAEESKFRNEGLHATWCTHFRLSQLNLPTKEQLDLVLGGK